ncbi:hypothetical protein ACFQDG_08320 [Natronoarchaeum mannanilyticum]
MGENGLGSEIKNVDESGENNRLDRRSLLKVAGSTGLGSVTLASNSFAKSGQDRTKIRKEETDASLDTVKSALDTEETQRILRSIDKSKIEMRDSSQIDIYIDEKQVGYSLKIPTENGTLSTTFVDSELKKAVVVLDRDSSNNTRQLSRNLGWPDGTDALLAYEKSFGTTVFARSVTAAEKQQCLDLIGRSDDPVAIEAIRPQKGGSGEYRVSYPDATYYLGHNINKIREKEEIESSSPGDITISGHGPGCVETGQHCLGDILASAPHFAAIGVGCSVTGLYSLGCIVIAADLLLPNVALIAVSGNCSWVVNNCQPYL